MLDKFMVLREDIRNVIEYGVGKGFEFDMRIPYYRGVSLSLVEDLNVLVDGASFGKDKLTFAVGGLSYTFDEMATMATLRWEFGEKATVFVPLKGGIPLGFHRIEIALTIRISYMGGGRTTKAVFDQFSATGG